MAWTQAVLRFARGVETGIQWFCKGMLLLTGFILLGVLTMNVVVRYILEGSMDWVSEVPALVFPWFVMGGVVMAAVRGAHVATLLALHLLPPAGRRVLAGVIHGVSAVVFLALAYYAVENTLIAHDEASTILRVPGSYGYSAIVLAFALIGLSSVTAFLRFVLGREPVLVDLAGGEGA